MSHKDYEMIGAIVAGTLVRATQIGGEELRTEIYDVLYRPLVIELQKDNERFDNLRFAGFVGAIELAGISNAS
jgi:hypothetical protein